MVANNNRKRAAGELVAATATGTRPRTSSAKSGAKESLGCSLSTGGSSSTSSNESKRARGARTGRTTGGCIPSSHSTTDQGEWGPSSPWAEEALRRDARVAIDYESMSSSESKTVSAAVATSPFVPRGHSMDRGEWGPRPRAEAAPSRDVTPGTGSSTRCSESTHARVMMAATGFAPSREVMPTSISLSSGELEVLDELVLRDSAPPCPTTTARIDLAGSSEGNRSKSASSGACRELADSVSQPSSRGTKFSDKDDTLLLRQVMADMPFATARGDRMLAWKKTAARVRAFDNFSKKDLTGKAAQSHFKALMKIHESVDDSFKSASGVMRKMSEKRMLLTELSVLVKEAHDAKEEISARAPGIRGRDAQRRDVGRFRDAAANTLSKRSLQGSSVRDFEFSREHGVDDQLDIVKLIQEENAKDRAEREKDREERRQDRQAKLEVARIEAARVNKLLEIARLEAAQRLGK